MGENAYKKLLSEIDAGRKAVMVTNLDSNQKQVLTQTELEHADGLVHEKAMKSLSTGLPEFFRLEDGDNLLAEPCFPEPRLIILGGGHIAMPLCEFAKRAGFSVTVIDDRPSFANTARFPEADSVICESFEKCFDLLSLNESTFVTIVTRGHRHDLDCLRKVLKHRTAYTGMIGSKRRVRGVMEILADEGYGSELLADVSSPIGLDIGAVTPDEIAISIVAQLIQFRRKVYPSGANWPEFDREVLEELAVDDGEARALVTITSTKGSVPRKAGAKMIVHSNGNISGSIGGGCSEGAVINNARYIIRNGGWMVQKVDMTGQVAEDEGMVCGGIMEVVIETV
jgi:xanthine dehydrogenase accessory factor